MLGAACGSVLCLCTLEGVLYPGWNVVVDFHFISRNACTSDGWLMPVVANCYQCEVFILFVCVCAILLNAGKWHDIIFVAIYFPCQMYSLMIFFFFPHAVRAEIIQSWFFSPLSNQELLAKARLVILHGHKLASNHHYALDLICQRCNELRYLSDILVNEIREKRVQLSRTFKMHKLLQQVIAWKMTHFWERSFFSSWVL